MLEYFKQDFMILTNLDKKIKSFLFTANMLLRFLSEGILSIEVV